MFRIDATWRPSGRCILLINHEAVFAHIGPFTCASDKELMLFNVQNGSTVYTHRTGSQSIANVDEYLRALTPHGTSGYHSHNDRMSH